MTSMKEKVCILNMKKNYQQVFYTFYLTNIVTNHKYDVESQYFKFSDILVFFKNEYFEKRKSIKYSSINFVFYYKFDQFGSRAIMFYFTHKMVYNIYTTSQEVYIIKILKAKYISIMRRIICFYEYAYFLKHFQMIIPDFRTVSNKYFFIIPLNNFTRVTRNYKK